MPELFIAADDFTGALDTGVKLSLEGISARVVSGPENIAPCDESVLVANLDSRHMDRDEAFRITFSACQTAFGLGAKAVYVKTDSGLRGNIGAYLEAAARVVNGRLLFAPAYPALNRRTENGVHMIGDVPVSRSVFGRDLLDPVTQDRTRDIIALQSSLPVYDAQTPYDGGSGPSIEIEELNTDEAILAYASEHAAAPLKAYAGLYSCRFSDVLEEKPDYDRIIETVSGTRLGAMLETSRTPAQAKELSRLGEQLGLDTRQIGERIVFNLGRAAKKLIDSGFGGTLCLFGGDCVSAALGRLGCRGLLPVREIEPGVVVSRAFLPDGELTLVTKSGGFGSPDILEKLIKTAEEEI